MQCGADNSRAVIEESESDKGSQKWTAYTTHQGHYQNRYIKLGRLRYFKLDHESSQVSVIYIA